MTAPLIDPVAWATDLVYAAGSRIGQVTKDTALSLAVAAQGIVPADPNVPGSGGLFADQINQAMNTYYQWVRFTREEQLLGLYGDGSDGAVAYAVDTTLTGDVYATDVTVSAGAIVTSANFRIFATGHCDVQAGCVIDCSGPDGAHTGFGDPGLAIASGTLAGGSDGGRGGQAPAEGGAAAIAGTALLRALGGAGAAGGDTVDNAAAAGGVVTVPTSAEGRARHMLAVLGRLSGSSIERFAGGSGGGGGAARDSAGGHGSGGGAGAGMISISARVLTVAGTIRANGGAGGSSGASLGGNGGGGGGGRVMLRSRERRGAGLVEALGGAGGTSAGSGASGTDGAAGEVIEWTG